MKLLQNGFLALESLMSIFLLASCVAAFAGSAWIVVQQEYAANMRRRAVIKVCSTLQEMSALQCLCQPTTYTDQAITVTTSYQQQIIKGIAFTWVTITASWQDLAGNEATYCVCSGAAGQ